MPTSHSIPIPKALDDGRPMDRTLYDVLRRLASRQTNIQATVSGITLGTVAVGVNDHHKLINLTAFDDHSQYFYLNGRATAQVAYGSSASALGAANLTIAGVPTLADTNAGWLLLTGSSAVTGVAQVANIKLWPYNTGQAVSTNQHTATYHQFFEPVNNVEGGRIAVGTFSGNVTGRLQAFGVGLIDFFNSAGSTYTGLLKTAATGQIGFIVRGLASQTGNLQQWQDNSSNILARVTSAGAIAGATGSGGTLTILGNDQTLPATVIMGNATITVKCNPLTIQNGNSGPVFQFAPAASYGRQNITGALDILMGNLGFDVGLAITQDTATAGAWYDFIQCQPAGGTTHANAVFAVDGNGNCKAASFIGPLANANSNFDDSFFYIFNHSDTSKKWAIDASNIKASTTRTTKITDDNTTMVGVVFSTTGSTSGNTGDTTAITTTHAGIYRMTIYAICTAYTSNPQTSNGVFRANYTTGGTARNQQLTQGFNVSESETAWMGEFVSVGGNCTTSGMFTADNNTIIGYRVTIPASSVMTISYTVVIECLSVS